MDIQLFVFLNMILASCHGQIFFPSANRKENLPDPEPCENDELYCGEDTRKYPKNRIEEILKKTAELKSSEMVRRFFKSTNGHETRSSDIQINIIQPESEDFACQSRRKLIPRYSRAKNVQGNWVYLAQIDDNRFQEVEVTVCSHPGKKCVNDKDSPHGEGSTLCKQMYTTQKLLAVDTLGRVNIDTFELPSSCICKTKVSSLFGLEIGIRSAVAYENDDNDDYSDDICVGDDASVAIEHDRFKRGPDFDDGDNSAKNSSKLGKLAANIAPCNDLNTVCDDDDADYPTNGIKLLMFSHKLFQSRAYFNKLFDRPCNPNILGVRGSFDLNEEALCYSHEKYIYPKKARNQSGKWKYIVNTDDYRQGVTVHNCVGAVNGEPCKYAGSQGIHPTATKCGQITSKHNMLSLSTDGTIDFDTFDIPSACVCKIVDKNLFDDGS